MTELPCPNCGSELTFLEQYQRYYCHQCQRYAPEGYGARGAKTCPTCGGVLSYVTQYDRFYCFRCNAYAAVDVTPPAAPEALPPAEPTAAPEAAPEAKPPEPVVALATVPEKAPETPPATTVQPPPELTPPAAPQPEPQPRAEPAPKETVPTPAAATAPEPAAEKPAEPEAEPPSMAMRILASSKPAVVRLKVFSLRKPELTDLCKAYELDPSGTKDQLQERLLNYLEDLEAEAQPEMEEPVSAAIPVAAIPKEERAEGPTAPVSPVSPQATVAPPKEKAPKTPAYATVQPHTQSVVIEEPPARTAAHETIPIVVTPVEVARVEHPCPTCERELSYISQYGRWYCYFCQRYAPEMRAKNACPTCGATLRWIEPYERWWCDSCRKYAPADLPRPNGAVAVAAAPMVRGVERPVVAAAVAQPMVSAHRHSNPNAGIGLVAFGIILFIAEVVLVEAPAVFSMNLGINVAPEYALVIRFFAFLFVALGAIAGLMAVRDRA